MQLLYVTPGWREINSPAVKLIMSWGGGMAFLLNLGEFDKRELGFSKEC